ncbi:twin-arginine translocase subunit TatC [Alteromonas oceanisediminis]|uniref:twin-arginine translocase subunit TatC n=1 Tax=Alteromonas oceanisediminis TaxID=2836180 RepID=UPI001BDA7C58|nr:twin-arginine translocase subunit TatC [Alteromonas oceanisediminis]MBT0587581.1 twin-arginine translocase subunit TatC [Alteromonas oceanisediminis]
MNSPETEVKTPLLTHLLELRKRLMLCLLFFAIAFGISYYFVEAVYAFLQQPLLQAFQGDSERRMIYTGLHEAFFTYLKLSFFSALFFTLPLVLNQIWKFIAPGLYRHEQGHFLPLFILTPVLFFCGAALAFYFVMPMAWEFFVGFETRHSEQAIAVQLEARVSEYLSLVIQLILAFGLCFELPVALWVAAKAGLLSPDSLSRYRRHAYVAVFLVAAFMTPPDLISQIALGVPVILLYEFSILLIRWSQREPAPQRNNSLVK